jgi:hypothetical protein
MSNPVVISYMQIVLLWLNRMLFPSGEDLNFEIKPPCRECCLYLPGEISQILILESHDDETRQWPSGENANAHVLSPVTIFHIGQLCIEADDRCQTEIVFLSSSSANATNMPS